MLDEDASFETRLILYAELPDTIASGHMLKDLHGVVATREMYVAWSHWSWLDDAKKVVALLRDVPRLEKMEFSTTTTKVQLKKLSLDHPQVLFEDVRAQLVWRTIASQMSFRCGSMLWHTHGAPGCTAGCVHSDPEKQAVSIGLLREFDHAIDVGQGAGCPVLQRMAQQQGLNSPLMKWVRKGLKSIPVGLPSVVVEILTKFWSSILNDKFIEDVNREIRGGETMDDTQVALPRVRAWQAGTQSGVLRRYGRAEVEVTTQAAAPTHVDWWKCFITPPVGECDEEEQEELEALAAIKLKGTKFDTYNPASEQQQFCDIAVLSDLVQQARLNLGPELWKSSLLPEGEAVVLKEQLFLVVRVYARGALMWPMRLGEHDEYLVDCAAKRLELAYITDVDDVRVHVLQAHSFLWQRVSGETPKCLSLRRSEGPLTLEQYHTSRGWASLGEEVLSQVHDELEIPKPALDDDAMQQDPEVCLQVNLTRAFDATATPECCLRRMHVATAPSNYIFDDFDLEWLRGCSLAKDVQELDEQRQQEKAKEEKNKKSREAAREVVYACFGKVPHPPKPSNKMAKAKWAKHMQRIYERIDKDADAVLHDLAPPDTHIFTDHDNGRWRCTYRPTKQQKSASWTRSGSKAAVSVLLKMLWRFATERPDSTLVTPKEVEELGGD